MLIRGTIIVALLTLTAGRAATVSERAVLWAIAQVETGGHGELVGPRGERSAYQFMGYTWARYTSRPFEQASTNPALADAIAHRHYQAIVAQLQRAGRPVTAKAVAQKWNPGAPADYAERVANLARAKR